MDSSLVAKPATFLTFLAVLPIQLAPSEIVGHLSSWNIIGALMECDRDKADGAVLRLLWQTAFDVNEYNARVGNSHGCDAPAASERLGLGPKAAMCRFGAC